MALFNIWDLKKNVGTFGLFEIIKRTHFSKVWLNSNPIWTFPFQLQKHTWNERKKTLKRGAKTVFTQKLRLFSVLSRHQNIRFLMWDEVKMSQLKLFLCFWDVKKTKCTKNNLVIDSIWSSITNDILIFVQRIFVKTTNTN